MRSNRPKPPVRKPPRQSRAKPAIPETGPEAIVRLNPLHRRVRFAPTTSALIDGKAQTAIYVHGIGNHPPEQLLVVRWDRALFKKDMGERSRMAYWVNRDRYPEPETCDCLDPQCACHDPQRPTRVRSVDGSSEPDASPEEAVRITAERLTTDKLRRDWLESLGDAMLDRARSQTPPATMTGKKRAGLRAAGVSATRAGIGAKGLFDSLLRGITDLVTGAVLPDVNDFLFDAQARQSMEDRLLARLRTGGGPFVVVAHSQGSMIAYDVLRQLTANEIEVPLLVTIGSPLGLPPVRAVFKKWTKSRKLPVPACVKRWVNVAAPGDVVAFDPDLADDVDDPGKRFSNHEIDKAEFDQNPLFRGNAHSSMGYLSTQRVRSDVRELVGLEFTRGLARQIVTPDLVEAIETRMDTAREPVLIEIAASPTEGDGNVTKGRERIGTRLRSLAEAQEIDERQLQVHQHARFVSARLNRAEIEVLRTEFEELNVHRVWKNMSKRALIARSSHMVQAAPAHEAFGATGSGISWAVLDTGIEHRHPHFEMHRNIASLWDCTEASPRKGAADIDEPRGGFVTWDGKRMIVPPGADKFADTFGHGTHVAGIIAGEFPRPLQHEGEALRFAGMAPKTRIHSFKVLDNQGDGEDAWIITALDKIASLNEETGQLRIHGVNLSLGGNFDPSTYGCGHTPLCVELRRLWRQGVLVVLAAGNEGFVVLQTLNEGPWQANLDLSIGDPANLDEAIAVGSVHRTNPHTFGVSYFSSRGPTADGRQKPDVVAPGEKIMSARVDFASVKRARQAKGSTEPAENYYIAESGTSMAAPHVSGVLAAFLSLRREFVGYPDRVKTILLDSCTDLQREQSSQGAGLVNLIKMLAKT